MPLGNHVKLLDAVTTGTSGVVGNNGRGREHVFYIYGAGTVSAGAVQIEEAHSGSYSGTWDAAASPVTVVSGTVDTVRLTGCYGALRARVSTTVTGAGGNVSVEYFSNVAE